MGRFPIFFYKVHFHYSLKGDTWKPVSRYLMWQQIKTVCFSLLGFNLQVLCYNGSFNIFVWLQQLANNLSLAT